MRALILDGTATAAHDLSDGGLAVALAEMAMASGIGAVLTAGAGRCARRTRIGSARTRRAISITVPADKADAVLARAQDASVPCLRIGVTGGDALALPGERPLPVDGAARALRSAGCRITWPAKYRRKLRFLPPNLAVP